MPHSKKTRKVESEFPWEKTFSLSVNELPEIEGWQVGGNYSLLLEVEQVETRINEETGKLEARFKMKRVGNAEEQMDFSQEYAMRRDGSMNKVRDNG